MDELLTVPLKIEKEAENTPNSGRVEWFLQGTLYPDV
jgi:GMP synthase (glutamine-hydrolysing)